MQLDIPAGHVATTFRPFALSCFTRLIAANGTLAEHAPTLYGLALQQQYSAAVGFGFTQPLQSRMVLWFACVSYKQAEEVVEAFEDVCRRENVEAFEDEEVVEAFERAVCSSTAAETDPTARL